MRILMGEEDHSDYEARRLRQRKRPKRTLRRKIRRKKFRRRRTKIGRLRKLFSRLLTKKVIPRSNTYIQYKKKPFINKKFTSLSKHNRELFSKAELHDMKHNNKTINKKKNFS